MVNALSRHSQIILLVLFIILFFMWGMLYIWHTGIFNAPDERMHFYNIKTIGDTGRLPQLTPEKVTKEAHQPPLYYWLAQPVYQLTGGASERTQVFSLRLFSLIISSSVIIMTYVIARVLWAGRPVVWLLAAGLVAFNPQFIFISGTINNDSLANALGTLGLLLIVLTLMRAEWRWPHGLVSGLVAAAAWLTKTVLWPVVVVLVVVTAWRAGKKQWRPAALSYTPLAGAAVWWLARNSSLYHSLTGFSYFKQLWYAEQHRNFLSLSGLWQWLRTMYESFWARFGYFNIVIDKTYYYIIEAVTIVAGLVGVYFIIRKFTAMERQKKIALIVLGAVAAGIIVGVFVYNVFFYLPLGRYLFPVFCFCAFLVGGGGGAGLPRRWGIVATALLIIFLLLIDWQSLLKIKQYG
jgi:4-amino-4-deoxy-L-arabinose transferase-like glycosyltransferase